MKLKKETEREERVTRIAVTAVFLVFFSCLAYVIYENKNDILNKLCKLF